MAIECYLRRWYRLRETKKPQYDTTQYAITLPTNYIKALKWKKKDKLRVIRMDTVLIIQKYVEEENETDCKYEHGDK